MLFNFCDPRLRPEIQCSTISTEGYEVNNLISDSSNGFLAYSCIKPPVNIDITFLCNISVNHILIWPYVGSQKSSGFQLYAKTSSDNNIPYTLLSTGYLCHSDSGLLVYPQTVNQETIRAPPNFLKRYIKPSVQYLTTYTNNLRICICKTENSVPALGKIEVWGTVSQRCGKDIVASVHTLWYKQSIPSCASTLEVKREDPPVSSKSNSKITRSTLDVPECFLDAITWEIMTQPILLPSGKIIDQSTLQKHEESEAVWGRAISDPFTGIPFNENRKPVVATALKLRIDKFLLDNSNADEVKKLPRVLGRVVSLNSREKKTLINPICMSRENTLIKSSSDVKVKANNSAVNGQKSKKHCHNLPVVVMCPKRTVADKTRSVKRPKINNSFGPVSITPQTEQDSDNSIESMNVNIKTNSDIDIGTLVPNLKRFDVKSEMDKESSTGHSCNCCTNPVLYQLPCNHVICRKVLTSTENNQCTFCSISYKTSEVKRIYE